MVFNRSGDSSNRLSEIGIAVILVLCSSGLAQVRTNKSESNKDSLAREEKSRLEIEMLGQQVAKLKADLAAAEADRTPTKAELEKQKLDSEIRKLKDDLTWYSRLVALLPGIGFGGLLLWIVDRMATARQANRLIEEGNIARSRHNLKLFKTLGSQEPRIRLGAVSELDQRIRILNAILADNASHERAKLNARYERDTIVRVLIAVTKYEKEEEVQKHIADLLAEALAGLPPGKRPAELKPDQPSMLASYDFQGAQLTNAWWQGIDAKGVDFYGATLARAGLADADFTEATLKNSNLEGATLRGAKMDRANLEGAKLMRVKAKRVSLRGAILRGADLTGADLSNAALDEADCRGVDFRLAKLEGTDLSKIIRDDKTLTP